MTEPLKNQFQARGLVAPGLELVLFGLAKPSHLCIILLMLPKVMLAPLSGVSDLSFRLISREHGAKFCFFEMLDSNALVYDHPANRRLIATHKKDVPIAGQLVGADPYKLLDAAEKLMSLVKISFLDINSACPAKKVVKKGAGAALLNDPNGLGRIVNRLSSRLPIPVTIKLRTAFSNTDKKDTAKIARICEANGASVIFIHGRTRAQGYAGEIDYKSIRMVKESVKIPVYGSGDILSPVLAKKMFDETGCDGILVARGALGNPWIFQDIETYLSGGKLPESRSLSLKKRTLNKHLSYLRKYKQATHENKMGIMGKVAMWYLKGLPNATRIRARICRVGSHAELKRIIESI
ncbi:MAG: tRNA dihydrouridine synthase DusB [Candidatus Omnitrophota bacterium]